MAKNELRFASEAEALQHLADVTGKRVKVAAKLEGMTYEKANEKLKMTLSGTMYVIEGNVDQINVSLVKKLLGETPSSISVTADVTIAMTPIEDAEDEEEPLERLACDTPGMLVESMKINGKGVSEDLKEGIAEIFLSHVGGGKDTDPTPEKEAKFQSAINGATSVQVSPFNPSPDLYYK